MGQAASTSAMNWSVQGEGAGADIGHVGHVPDVERGFERRHLQDRGRADAHPLDPRAGAVGGSKAKGASWPSQPDRAGRAVSAWRGAT